MKKTCIIIAGPTAVGKTAFAIELARHFSTEIISADSRQCFKELSIGVARPSSQELSAVPHHFIASHSITAEMTAAGFEAYALDRIEKIFAEHDVAVMVGGTGLYIKAFCEGLDPIPPVEAQLRSQILTDYESKGLVWLQRAVEKEDPAYYKQGEIFNPQRLMRALEVKRTSGNSIIEYQSKKPKHREFNILKFGLDMARPALYERINQRVDRMMVDGLLEEAKQLLPYKDMNALQTVGYRELFSYLAGDIQLPEAVELIKQNSRRYAKRQLTWFKRDESIAWLQAGEDNNLSKVVRSVEDQKSW